MSDRLDDQTGGFVNRLKRFINRFGNKKQTCADIKQLSTPLLRSKAAEMRSDKCRYDYMVQKIRASMEEIGQLWKNDIHQSFIEDFDGMQIFLRDFSHMLDEYVSLLDFAAAELEYASDRADSSPVLSSHPEKSVDVVLPRAPSAGNRRADIESYDPYLVETQAGVSTELLASRKNLEYVYNVYSDHIELVQYLGLKKSVSVPSELDGLPVTHIGPECFAMVWRSSLESITLPDSVTTIHNGAFRGCQSVRELRLPDGLKYIGNYAFAFMSSLENVRIPKGVISIGTGAFRNCNSLISVEIPDSTLRIGNDCFYRCRYLETVRVGNGVIDIDGWAFRMSERLSSVTLGRDVANIGDSAFYDCVALDRLEIPNNVMKIGDSAFYHRRGMTIGCSRGSVAESYAIENKLNYVLL
jgi:uncharacterized protein YukE